jgi:hypothetical protein
MHIVLLGDSSFDNAPYVARGEEVIATLTRRLPDGWRATLNARDGAVTREVQGQLRAVPEDATHLVVSVGGNDALGVSGVLQQPARSVAESLEQLARIRDAFAEEYRAMLGAVLARKLPVAISTIYEARFSEQPMRRIGAAALTVLNDFITREASVRGLPVIDLRAMFSEDADYANAIEPSGRGSEKIAAAILSLVNEHDFGRGRSTTYVR